MECSVEPLAWHGAGLQYDCICCMIDALCNARMEKNEKLFIFKAAGASLLANLPNVKGCWSKCCYYTMRGLSYCTPGLVLLAAETKLPNY